MKGLSEQGRVGMLQGRQCLLSSTCHPSNEAPFPCSLMDSQAKQSSPATSSCPSCQLYCGSHRARQHPCEFLLWARPSFLGSKFFCANAPSFPSQPCTLSVPVLLLCPMKPTVVSGITLQPNSHDQGVTFQAETQPGGCFWTVPSPKQLMF